MSLRAKFRYSVSAATFRLGSGAALGLGALLATSAAQAQQVPAPDAAVAASARPAPSAYRNALRFDLGGVFISNLVDGLLNTNSEVLLPVLISYERQLRPRFSLVAEGLINGGTPNELKAGLGVQGRYYLVPARSKAPLAGLYMAPALSYRAVQLSGYRQPETHQRFAVMGALVGWQVAVPKASRVFLDASLGIMAWQKLGKNKVTGASTPDYYTPDSYYERTPVNLDGRLGIGFKF